MPVERGSDFCVTVVMAGWSGGVRSWDYLENLGFLKVGSEHALKQVHLKASYKLAIFVDAPK